MQFLVLGYDGSDDQAVERRMAVREDHLAGSRQMYAAGRWQDSGALLDDADTMIGSFIVCDYASREELENEWLNHEPYVIGEVWKRIEIHPVLISPRACSDRSAPTKP
jgi:uncharacterized protein